MEFQAKVEKRGKERIRNGTAGSETLNSSSGWFLDPGPGLKKMEQLITDYERNRDEEGLEIPVQL